MYRFLADEEELRWFYDFCIPYLKDDEVFFISLSARNKHLTPDEREQLSLGRTEMFNKQVIRKDNYDDIKQQVIRYECNEGGYLTRNYSNIPQKCLIVYWNINPTSSRRVLKEAITKSVDLNEELINASIKNNVAGINSAYFNIRKYLESVTSLYSQYQGSKYWVDFDVDLPNKDHLNEIIQQIRDNLYKINDFIPQASLEPGDFVIIETKGGFHLLLKRSCLRFPPFLITDSLKKILLPFTEGQGEVNYNANAMIPLPGTYQADFPVRVLNKDDFKSSQQSIKQFFEIIIKEMGKTETPFERQKRMLLKEAKELGILDVDSHSLKGNGIEEEDALATLRLAVELTKKYAPDLMEELQKRRRQQDE